MGALVEKVEIEFALRAVGAVDRDLVIDREVGAEAFVVEGSWWHSSQRRSPRPQTRRELSHRGGGGARRSFGGVLDDEDRGFMATAPRRNDERDDSHTSN